MADIKKFDNKLIGLNCGNCPNYSTTPHPLLPTYLYYCGKERISEHQKWCTEHKGCASHPLALQVLSAPVIAELERLLNESADESYCDAIKLLKGSE